MSPFSPPHGVYKDSLSMEQAAFNDIMLPQDIIESRLPDTGGIMAMLPTPIYLDMVHSRVRR